MEYIGLGEQVKRLRQERAWSQTQLADIAGLSERTVQRVEKLDQCSYETLMAVASAFEVDVREFTRRLPEVSSREDDAVTYNAGTDGTVGIGKRRWSSTRIAVISSLVMLPALYITLAHVLADGFDIWFLATPLQAFYSNPEISDMLGSLMPLVIVASLAGAVILNLVAMTSIRFIRSQNGWMSLVRFVPRKANMSVLGLSTIVTVAIITLRLVENTTYY